MPSPTKPPVCLPYLKVLKINSWMEETAQWVEVLAAKPTHLCFFSRAHVIKGEKSTLQSYLLISTPTAQKKINVQKRNK